MKKVYYVECDCSNSQGLDFVFYANEKIMATFTTRKEAVKWLIGRTRFIKEWCKDEIKDMKKRYLDLTISVDCYKFLVEDDFDIGVGNVWGNNYEYQMIDSRYLCGRY